MKRNPIQPLSLDSRGVMRFKENKIIRNMLDRATQKGIMDLNSIACEDYSQEDRQQFAQLIGYSLSGYGELSYVDDSSFATASEMAETGNDEKDARIEFLEGQLNELKSALRIPMATLFEKHPDDLMEER
ncbi:MAG: hypothetical protein IPO40_24930 [Fibrobacteres bacterium]|nr:hypothetical protein [Fibrobacterota bacterium]